MEERDTSLDFIRSFGMILVVLGHVSSVYGGFIYLFHVPLFFIVSGALFKRTESVWSDLYKKWKRLYLPNLKYGILFLLLHNMFVSWGIYTSDSFYVLSDFLKSGIKILCFGNEQLGGAMWFLRTLFFAYCLYLVYSCFKCKSLKVVFFLLVVCAGWCMVCKEFLFQLRTFITIPCLIFPFILIGGGKICLLLDRILERSKYFPIIFLLLSGLILLLLSRCTSVDLAYLKLPNPLLYYMVVLVGLLFVLSCNRIILGSWLQRVVIYVGKHSVPVLALHFLAFKLVTLCLNNYGGFDLKLSDFPMPLLPDKVFLPLLYTLTGIGLPLLCNLIYNYLKHILRRRL